MAESQSIPRVALIGFGEAGETFARASAWTHRAWAWDIDEQRRPAMANAGVDQAVDPAEAVASAEIVLCVVTADQALGAARDYAPGLRQGALWCDMNSVAPETKRAAADVIERAGGWYVDAAIMAPVAAGLAVPLLLAGAHAADAERILRALGFSNVKVIEGDVGRASAIKMIRSVMVKGLEALSAECAAAAAAADVLDEVAASLDASEGRLNWAARFAYNRERMATHGLRRAAEMEEAAKTLLGLGVEPVMTRGTIELQRRAGRAKDTTSA